jgi:hypothetical protein
MKLISVILIVIFFLTGCAEYYVAHEKFSTNQSLAIQASSALITETKTTMPNGTVIEERKVANPMASWAATQMQAPIEPGSAFYQMIRSIAPWAFAVWAAQSFKDIATSNKGNSTTVNGNSNITGNTAGGNVGSPVRTETVTNTTTAETTTSSNSSVTGQ